MKEKFPALFAALQVEEMQMQEGGAFLNEELLATLNAHIEAKEKETADATALAESLTTEKNELTAKVEEMNTEHAKAVGDLTAAHATAIEEKDAAIAALEQEKADLQSDMEGKAKEIDALKSDIESKQIAIDGAKESLATAESTIAERDQQIADLSAQVADLQNNPGEGAQAGSVQNNGSGAEAQEVAISTQYVMDPNKTYEENMKAKKEWEAARK